MNARKLTKTAIKQAISKGNYELIEVLATGEVLIAIVSDLEKEVLSKVQDLPNKVALEKIKTLNSITNNQGEELIKVYERLDGENSKHND